MIKLAAALVALFLAVSTTHAQAHIPGECRKHQNEILSVNERNVEQSTTFADLLELVQSQTDRSSQFNTLARIAHLFQSYHISVSERWIATAAAIKCVEK